MRLVDADELIERAWRDKLDSRELIVQMIATAPTIKEIPTNIPIHIFERLLESAESEGQMYSIVLTDGKIININADEVEWCEKPRMIKLIKKRYLVARINMDNVVGWIKTEYNEENEPQESEVQE